MRQTGLMRALAVICALAVSGCAARGPNRDAMAVDSMTTGAIASPTAVSPVSEEEMSDSMVIGNTLASLPEGLASYGAIAWENRATGSVGEILDVAEQRNGRILCRRFATSRASFDGVSLYRGESCQAPSGAWWMKRFEPA